MPAYVVVQIEVEPVRYAEYKRVAAPSTAAYGGRYVVRGGACEILELTWLPPGLVILEFANAERGRSKAWSLWSRRNSEARLPFAPPWSARGRAFHS